MKEELSLRPGPITISRVMKFKESLQIYLGKLLEHMEVQDSIKAQEIIHTQLVELQHYVEMEELVNLAMKVERQQKQKNSVRSSSNSSNNWTSNWSKFVENKKGLNLGSKEKVEEVDKGKGRVHQYKKISGVNLNVKEESLEQRENIFHPKCLVSGKLCSMIIDGASCTNIANAYMVEKLELKCEKHPNPMQAGHLLLGRP
ncbi:uncharacterized protein G2W53_017423 [Senna tora]|uniref:Uncharacterized protein n=1 Tax=Senna tora TaxID=362788 RepID=A0A834TYD9_9FABA|nr:uncharacterized protein G2W53_017423 [Senna tora]